MALKTLTSTGIINGNPILPGQVTQSVDAFTGIEGYAITISGSFELTGATTGSGVFSEAISASNITTAVTGGGTHYLTFVDQAGTRPPKVASLLEYNAATNNLTVTASFATNYTNPILVEGTSYPSGSALVPNAPLKFIAGADKTDGSNIVVVNISQTSGKIYGQSLFIVATTSEPAAAGSVSVQFPVAPPNITFVTSNPNTDFNYQIIYI